MSTGNLQNCRSYINIRDFSMQRCILMCICNHVGNVYFFVNKTVTDAENGIVLLKPVNKNMQNRKRL